MPGVLFIEVPEPRTGEWQQALWNDGWYVHRLSQRALLDRALAGRAFQAVVTGDSHLARQLAARSIPVVLCVAEVAAAARALERRAGSSPVAIVALQSSAPDLCAQLRRLLAGHLGEPAPNCAAEQRLTLAAGGAAHA